MKASTTLLSTALICILTCDAGCSSSPAPADSEIHQARPTRVRSHADRLGTRFIHAGIDVDRAPWLTEIPVPDIPGGDAIWGGTGRDDDGNIWFGVCSEGIEIPSAHLFSYDPTTNKTTNRGDVVSWLKKLGIWRDGECQMKIHSKIVEADDGFVYFASLDEQEENGRRMIYPKWGGHLWRINRRTNAWEHLRATKEALIAVSCTGRYVYALGYFNHVLYQYDTKTAESQSLEVGSYRAHSTRNFLTDLNHHVYVPRVSGDETDENVTAELVEFDQHLHELGAHKLNEYQVDGSFDRHGIVGFVCLADGSVCFTSHSGFLWHLVPDKTGPATLHELGWFHPEGESYTASLMTFDGKTSIAGFTRTKSHGGQWVIRRLDRDETEVVEFDEASRELLANGRRLLYGTNTRDNDGSAYFVGRCKRNGEFLPILLRACFESTGENSTQVRRSTEVTVSPPAL